MKSDLNACGKCKLFAIAALAAASLSSPAAHAGDGAKTLPGVYDVRDYGAVGDGRTLDTSAMQRAIDACSAGGGGTVRLGPGLYLSGTLVLKNRVTLLIERGATLQGSRNIEHYPNLVPKIPYLYSDRFCKYLIYADGAGDIGCSITGIPQAAIENVALHNIRIEFQGGGAGELGNAVIPEKVPAYPQEIMFGKLPAYGLFCRHVKNLSLDNVAFHFVRPDHRPALACDDVGNLQLSRFNADLSPDAEEMMRLKNVAGASIHNCGSPRDIPVLLRLSGKRCRRIALTGAEQFNILKPISLDDDVPPDAVVGRHDSNR